MDYLFSKGYFLESPTEQAFLKAVLTNQPIEFSSDFFYTHLTKTTGVLSFFKFTKDIDTRTQLSLLNSLYSYFSTNEPDEKRSYYPLG